MPHPVLACSACTRVRPLAGRGLCGTCYARDAIARGVAGGWKRTLRVSREPWRSPRLRDAAVVRMGTARPSDAGVPNALSKTQLLPKSRDLRALAYLLPTLPSVQSEAQLDVEERPRRDWQQRNDGVWFLASDQAPAYAPLEKPWRETVA